MIWSTLQNRIKTPITLSGDSCRVLNTDQLINIFYIAATILLLFLTQTKIVIAEESIYDEPSNLKVGTIDRTAVDHISKRTNNINGVKYEVIEVRDQINDLIAKPILLEDNIIPEDVVVIESIEAAKPIVPTVQKTEVLITEYSKPKIDNINNKQALEKPVIAQSLTLLPVKERQTNYVTDKVIVEAKHKPVYKKHDIDGVLLDHDTEQWTCIHDTQNGLMWEVKSNNDDMRNSNNLYSWFNPDNQTANGIADGGRCEGNFACDTNAYVQAMNKQNFCGHNDWQLPTREQMQTLVYLKNDDKSVKINKEYFPETVASWYWTASENNDNKNFAWYILFRNGTSLNDLKERPKHIRLVRKYI